jgi:1-acyl-sn-glycerol-3-phosphate acyltransferase
VHQGRRRGGIGALVLAGLTIPGGSAERAGIQHTIFDTPIVSTLLRGLSRGFARLRGWQVLGSLPPEATRCVLIAAPHTSNWDLPYTLMVAFCLRLRIHWLGKASLFRGPFGPVMRWLGGIPVDRSKANNLVADAALAIATAPGPLQLVIPPEGTRGKTRHWKTGFYFIALQAQVPIVLAYIDYPRKRGGLGPVFVPTGDVDKDMAEIKRFYAGIRGRNEEQFSAD